MTKRRSSSDRAEPIYDFDFFAPSPAGGLPVRATPVGNGSATLITTASATANQDINGLLSGIKWSTTNLTYSFPTSASQYGTYNTGYNEKATFAPVNATMKLADIAAIDMYDSVSGLTLTENIASPGAATIRFGMSSAANPTAYAYYPANQFYGGDIWFGKQTDASAMTNPVKGNYAWASAMHELGHALGLKHGQETGGPANTAMTFAHNSMEFSVMTYLSYVGASPSGGYTNEQWGFAQTPMMYDIAAIQTMYGANFGLNSGSSVYTFSSATGEMFINGAGQGAPGGNRIFLTVWDGGGIDTYDFSNYPSDGNISQLIDLTPGGWSLVSSVQQANLGNGHFARGNVFNAVQYQGDVRSLIENAIGTAGSDTIVGNNANNNLQGRSGNDGINGGGGDDTLTGGSGNDLVDGGAGAGDIAVFASTFGASTVVYNAGSGTFIISSALDGTDTIVNVENFQFADIAKTAAQLAGQDTTAPQLLSLSPLDDATGVPVNANIVLTFNEAVKAGLGNIVIYNSNGTVARTIAVTDITQVAFSGSILTINPATDLAGGSGFYVNMAPGVITDASGNAFAGISGSTAYNLTTLADTVAPTLSNATPLDNATAVNPAANIVLTFSENVQAGSGNVVIYNALNNSVARTISISDGSQVNISGNVITVNPAADLAQGTAYYVNIASGVIEDLSGNDFAGISGTTAYNFATSSDLIAPRLTGLSPADNARNVSPTANFTLTFNENVKAGTGTIQINNSNGTLAQSISIADTSQVSFSGNVVTIDPTITLTLGKSYFIGISAGAIEDIAGNDFAGIAGKSTYNFSVSSRAAPPAGVEVSIIGLPDPIDDQLGGV